MSDTRDSRVVIPSRMASTRLPGKPLAEIAGEPMIVHVWRRATEAGVGPVLVACAEPEIAAAVEAATAVETAAAEPSKPIYKKWWFYVGLAAVVLVVAAAASPQEEDEPQGPPSPTGTVTVGVRVR